MIQQDEQITKKQKISENQEKVIPQEQQEKEDQDSQQGEEQNSQPEEQKQSKKERDMFQNQKRRIFFANAQKNFMETDILKIVNKFIEGDEEEIQIHKIYKQKGKFFAVVEFETPEEKEKFEARFEAPENSNKTKNMKIRKEKSAQDLNIVAKKGKLISKVKKYQEKNQQKPVATQEQLDEVRKTTIVDRVCPLLNTPYEKQLEQKRENFQEVLGNWKKRALKDMGGDKLPSWLLSEYPVEITEVLDCEESQRIRYRNKSEFTCGKDLDGNIKVGMNKGSMSNGTIAVDSADGCLVLTEEQLLIAEILEEYIKSRQGVLDVYERYDKVGFYKSLMIRQSQKTKQMSISLVCSNMATPEQLAEEKENFLNLFVQKQSEKLANKLKENEYKIVSLNIQITSSTSEGQAEEPFEQLYGEQFYIEEILGKKFKVSPQAFLQNHIQQTDKLYSKIRELIQTDINNDTVFLDVCSGLGTIGMCMAETCKEAIGIEMVKEACDAAVENAELNNIKNYRVICSKVEDVMADVIQKHKEQNPNTRIVAVVDPPRPGLHKSVVKALRSCELIDNLVYVACSAPSIIDNLNYLCLPSAPRRGSTPFTPAKSFVVDLFPNTSHYEAIFFLQRNQGEEIQEE